jgi:antitoxin component of MazEF toxin-antitoxin module
LEATVFLCKVRKDGNSLVVTIPVEEAAKARLHAGDYVEVETSTMTGEIIVRPITVVRGRIQETGREVIAENREALDILKAYVADET